MKEILTGLIMALDVVTIYLLLPHVKHKFFLSFWTGFLHVLFPLIGFSIGTFIVKILLQWSYLISSIFLFLFGINILLSDNNRQAINIPLVLLAIYTSIDSFSVSISFGMLNLEMYLFVLSAGISTFILSYISLIISKRNVLIKGGLFRYIAGLSLIAISIYTFIQQ